MKNQVSPPFLTISRPAALASAQVSYAQWTVLGVHFSPVRSEAAAPFTRNTLFLSLVIGATASATDEVGTSTITSTFLVSYHSRAMLEPMSALFWLSLIHISEPTRLLSISYAV